MKRSKDEINRLLDEYLPGVFEEASERERTALVVALKKGMHPDDAEEFAEGAEERAAQDSKNVANMEAAIAKHMPRNPDITR